MSKPSAEELLRVFRLIYSEDVKFKILEELAFNEALNLRSLARSVGMHHGNLRRYLEELVEKRIVKYVQVSPTRGVYMINDCCNFLRELLRRTRP